MVENFVAAELIKQLTWGETRATRDLDQRIFFLDAKAHTTFLALLNEPTLPHKALRVRMRRPPAWTR